MYAMGISPNSKSLPFAGLTFVTVILSFAIREVTGTWPSELGYWGVVVLTLFGIGLLAAYFLTRSSGDTDTVST